MSKLRINNHIRRLRFNADEMTQQQLAEKVGVTRQTIIALENKKYSPTLDLAYRIAYAFEVPLEEVFFIESTEQKETYSNGIQYKINL
jgi:putative transcriptional regulator